ncbi:MAG: hypothetical protein JNK49_04695 [Planctomycetes bacterium]|nr:hypothetical protein [Planctomycetota bacterium]
MAAVALRHLCWLPLFCCALAAQTPAPGGGATPPATPPAAPAAQDPALPELLKELKSLVADPKMAGDFQAIGLIQKLAKEPETRHPKDKERLAKAFGEVFRTGKLRPGDKAHLYEEAGQALGKFGEDGAKELAKVVGDNRFKEHQPLRAKLLLEIGRTQDEKQAELLLNETSRSPHDEIRGAGGEALGLYDDMDLKLRREVVKLLIREWGSLHSQATRPVDNSPQAQFDPGPQNAQRTLRVVEDKWRNTLSKLTGQTMSTLPDWQRWLNKNSNWAPPGATKKA